MSIRNVARYRGKRFIRAWWRTVAERSVQRTDIAMPGMKDEMKDRLHQWRVGRSLDFARDDTSTRLSLENRWTGGSLSYILIFAKRLIMRGLIGQTTMPKGESVERSTGGTMANSMRRGAMKVERVLIDEGKN